MNSNTSSFLTRREFITSGTASLSLLGLMSCPTLAESTFSKLPHSSPILDTKGYYQLPPLPYAYSDLEPFIDEQTMQLHHDIHFASYMQGLNDALKNIALARQNQDFSQLNTFENSLAFNGGGYILHTLFFSNMAPAGKAEPSVWLKDTLAQHFGDINSFKSQFSAVALGVQGSGWAILGYQPLGQKYLILQVEKHQNATQWNIIPILALDVWEHAYYLKYQNKRKDYIQNWWNIVHWNNVEERMRAASFIQVF
jgi:superoxide dismutase, Fe-Mn family